MNVFVTITAYNEAKNIAPILRTIRSLEREGCRFSAIVVDDGSTDGTGDIVEAEGGLLYRHPINLGQGYALLTGFMAALERVSGDDDIIIEMDGDGQHDPTEIPHFLDAMATSPYDIVVGSRILGSNYQNAPFFRRTFLPFFTAVINRLTGYDMTDSMCGFRAFRAGSLRRTAHLFERMLEPQYIAAEMFMRFSRAGLTVGEIPIHLKDRSTGSSYKGFVRYGLGVLKAILKTGLDQTYRSGGAR